MAASVAHARLAESFPADEQHCPKEKQKPHIHDSKYLLVNIVQDQTIQDKCYYPEQNLNTKKIINLTLQK